METDIGSVVEDIWKILFECDKAGKDAFETAKRKEAMQEGKAQREEGQAVLQEKQGAKDLLRLRFIVFAKQQQ